MKILHYMRFSLMLVMLFAGISFAGSGEIIIIPVSDAIGPGIADFVLRGISRADDQNAACVIIELDTPGGLADAMREIVMSIYAAKTPVVVYVSPSGARAASAGVMITMAADIAAMAPGTNIGAAHPVATGGKEIGGRHVGKGYKRHGGLREKHCGKKRSQRGVGGKSCSRECLGNRKRGS